MTNDEHRIDMDEQHKCPGCGQWQDEAECFLGQLGRLTHFRCRYCGIIFNSEGGVRA